MNSSELVTSAQNKSEPQDDKYDGCVAYFEPPEGYDDDDEPVIKQDNKSAEKAGSASR
jgi:regulator of RNase E activity RraB